MFALLLIAGTERPLTSPVRSSARVVKLVGGLRLIIKVAMLLNTVQSSGRKLRSTFSTHLTLLSSNSVYPPGGGSSEG
jgi:hypothetical protein